jgi:hypothetical protein
MAKWAATYETFTPVPVSNATNFTDAGYWALQGGVAAQAVDVYEIYLVGQSTVAGNMNSMVWARDGVNGATITALSSIQSQGALNPASVAPTSAPVAFSATTTKPQRSVTTSHARLVLGFNPFGGVARWWVPAGSGAEFKLLSNTTPFGEASISCTTIGVPAAMMATIQYEVY